jgi:putative N6-adenine-specific DNA methylase
VRHDEHREGPRERSRGQRTPRKLAELSQHFFVSCSKGLEGELVKELTEIGVADARPAAGGVAFQGDMRLAWKVNLWSRLAIRVLRRVAEGPYANEDDLYRGAREVEWTRLLDVSQTLAVNTVARKSPLQSLNFATLRIKDAVCDCFRAACGERPSVDTHNPDVPLLLYLTEERYNLYLDLSGEPLNRRGFRVEPAAAPINENLAAGILRLSGWNPDIPLYDPMMGGGTFLVEAAMMALNIAPGLKRHFAFEKFKDFDMIEWQRLRKDAEAVQLEPQPLAIYGSDIDPLMVRAAGLNLQAAGLFDCVRLREADFLEVDAPPGPGFIVCNPPYGVRLEVEDVAGFYKAMGDALKKRFAGWTAFFISADLEFPKLIGLSSSRRTPLYNGPLECRLFAYEVVQGSNRK